MEGRTASVAFQNGALACLHVNVGDREKAVGTQSLPQGAMGSAANLIFIYR